jgi:hypothetical protein
MSRHQITAGNTTVPELAGGSWQAGSIPVRLRFESGPPTSGFAPWRARGGRGSGPG